jgi:hypothetical protein
MRETLLIVDDEAAIRKLICRKLLREDHECNDDICKPFKLDEVTLNVQGVP